MHEADDLEEDSQGGEGGGVALGQPLQETHSVRVRRVDTDVRLDLWQHRIHAIVERAVVSRTEAARNIDKE